MGPDSMGTVGGVYTINYFYDGKRADTMCVCVKTAPVPVVRLLTFWTLPTQLQDVPMLIVGQRGRVDESIERVLHTAADDPDGLHATGQVSTRQQDE